jgi:hypothetical protein
VIASPGIVVPYVAWPYAEIFTSLHSESPLQVAKAVFRSLSDFYELAGNRCAIPKKGPTKDEVPFSLLDLQNLTETTSALKKLVGAIQTNEQAQRSLREPECRQLQGCGRFFESRARNSQGAVVG